MTSHIFFLAYNQQTSISFSQGQESLSVLDLSKDKHFHVKHYRIRRTDQGLYYISSKSVFPTLQDLVEHYRSKSFLKKIFRFEFCFLSSKCRWFMLFVDTALSEN